MLLATSQGDCPREWLDMPNGTQWPHSRHKGQAPGHRLSWVLTVRWDEAQEAVLPQAEGDKRVTGASPQLPGREACVTSFWGTGFLKGGRWEVGLEGVGEPPTLGGSRGNSSTGPGSCRLGRGGDEREKLMVGRWLWPQVRQPHCKPRDLPVLLCPKSTKAAALGWAWGGQSRGGPGTELVSLQGRTAHSLGY